MTDGLTVYRRRQISCPEGFSPSNGLCAGPTAPERGLGQCRGDGSNPQVGNPISVLNGNKFQRAVDFPEHGARPPLVRYYNSSGYTRDGRFGVKWRGTYDVALTFYPDNATPSYVALEEADGRVLYFQEQSDGSWAGDADIDLVLAETAQGWEVSGLPSASTYSFDAQGRLVRIEAPGSGAWQLIYGDDGALDRATNELGQYLDFSVNDQGDITQVAGRGVTISYGYDESGRLRTVSRAGAVEEEYLYEDPDFPHAMTGVLSADGTRIATWDYDDQGRAVSSAHGGVPEVELDFSSENATTVTNALGKQTTYHFQAVAGVRKLTDVEGHPTANCAAATRIFTYTDQGRVASKTDWNGNTTTYEYNDRGLVIRKVEAAGTPEERVTTKTWHPEYRLPDVVTEPERVIDHDYDEQGRLRSREIRARQ